MRHLLYFVLPVEDGSGVWQWNCSIIRRHMSVFDGRKLVAVVTSDPTGRFRLARRDEVGRELPGCEFLEFANDPRRRDGVAWADLWAALNPAPDDHVLWAHAKGVSRSPGQHETVCRWTEAMADVLLGRYEMALAALEYHSLAGCFKMRGRHFVGSESDWHYSGAFVWYSAGAAREAVNTVPLDDSPYCVEAWPGKAFHANFGACLFVDLEYGPCPLYDPHISRVWLAPALDHWKKAHEAS